jgi:hypothetical protein
MMVLESSYYGLRIPENNTRVYPERLNPLYTLYQQNRTEDRAVYTTADGQFVDLLPPILQTFGTVRGKR